MHYSWPDNGPPTPSVCEGVNYDKNRKPGVSIKFYVYICNFEVHEIQIQQLLHNASNKPLKCEKPNRNANIALLDSKLPK